MMRYKNFMMEIGSESIFIGFGEFKKRQYIIIADLQGRIIGFKKFVKEKDEGYFLLFENEN